MKKDLGSKPYIFPQPVLIIATYNEDGSANAMNAAWGGITGYDELVIDLGSHKTTDNIMRTKAFTVSIGDVDHVVQCDYVGLVSGRKVSDKLERAGFSVTPSRFVNAPVINELPLALECTLEKTDGSKIYAKIANVCADESILDKEGQVDLFLFRPVVYDTSKLGYYSLGERVAAAFSAGKAVK